MPRILKQFKLWLYKIYNEHKLRKLSKGREFKGRVPIDDEVYKIWYQQSQKEKQDGSE